MKRMVPLNGSMLRPVTSDDLMLIFEWTNEDAVRKNSFHQHPITLSEHKRWFESVLKDKAYLFYLFIVHGHPVGQIRVHVENSTGYISYSIAKEFRGQGFGSAMLAELERVICSEKLPITTLIAEVKSDNIASIKRFEQAGYRGIELVRYIKDLSPSIRDDD